MPFGDMNLPDVGLYLHGHQQAVLTAGTQGPNYNLDFTTLDNPDLLENFDFDTFLNEDASTFPFEPNLNYPADGVETGTGDTL